MDGSALVLHERHSEVLPKDIEVLQDSDFRSGR